MANDSFRVIRDRYPELVEHGGLGGALRWVAQIHDIVLGTLGSPYKGGVGELVTASIDGVRGIVIVSADLDERSFHVSIRRKTVLIATGETNELFKVVKLAEAWEGGASHADLIFAFPFLDIMALARVLASPDPVAAQWEWLREAPEMAVDRDMVNPAYGNPVLRSCFPDLSHRVLSLSSSFCDRRDEVRISSQDDARCFTVEQAGRDRWIECTSIAEAVIVAAEFVNSMRTD